MFHAHVNVICDAPTDDITQACIYRFPKTFLSIFLCSTDTDNDYYLIFTQTLTKVHNVPKEREMRYTHPKLLEKNREAQCHQMKVQCNF
jgi:hypothetical protein